MARGPDKAESCPEACALCAWPAGGWTAAILTRWSEPRMVVTLTVLALAIRLYLMMTNFCIASDGVAYVRMARLFAAGDWNAAMSAVFSPLYPILIALVHRAVPDWELAGSLVSMVFGVATVPMVYFLARRVHDGRALAAGAAALVVIHPELASYSASVLTEAGYIFLVAAAVYFMVRGVKAKSARLVAVSGLLNGLAYLYRTEAAGLVVVLSAFLVACPWVWGEWRIGFGARAAAAFVAAFALVASPYVIYLRLASGHWIVGRELSAALMYKIGEASTEGGAHWRALAFARYVPLLAPLRQQPVLYLKKAALDFVHSFYYFAQAMEPLFLGALLIGLYTRGRAVLTEWREALPASTVCFYFCGLALLYTGQRFLTHYIVLTFGWAALGVATAALWASRLELPDGRRLPAGAVPLALALITLPRALWPLGYDMRGYREAGAEIARAHGAARAVVSTDSRVAFYSGTEHLALPTSARLDLCQWLQTRPQAGYVMLTSREEERSEDLGRAPCLVHIRRYRRYGRGYYDLFRVSDAPHRP